MKSILQTLFVVTLLRLAWAHDAAQEIEARRSLRGGSHSSSSHTSTHTSFSHTTSYHPSPSYHSSTTSYHPNTYHSAPSYHQSTTSNHPNTYHSAPSPHQSTTSNTGTTSNHPNTYHSAPSYHQSTTSNTASNTAANHNNNYHSTSSSSSSSSSSTTTTTTNHYYHSSPTVFHSSTTYYNGEPAYYYNNGNHGMSPFAAIMLFVMIILIVVVLTCLIPGTICFPMCAGCCCGLFAADAMNSTTTTTTTTTNTEETKFMQYNNDDYNGGYNTFDSSPPDYPYTSETNQTNPDFEDCARIAKQEVEDASTSRDMSQPQQTITPYSGPYTTSYVDRTTGVQHGATLHLNFTPDFRGKGYKLSGEGYDIDGNTVIEDGHVNYDGTAWWRERTITKDVGLIVLSRGTFDFLKRTFNGTWLASTMEHGAYIIFEAASNNDAAIPSAPQDHDTDIPEATAMQVYGEGEHGAPYASAVPATPSAPPEPKSKDDERH